MLQLRAQCSRDSTLREEWHDGIPPIERATARRGQEERCVGVWVCVLRVLSSLSVSSLSSLCGGGLLITGIGVGRMNCGSQKRGGFNGVTWVIMGWPDGN